MAPRSTHEDRARRRRVRQDGATALRAAAVRDALATSPPRRGTLRCAVLTGNHQPGSSRAKCNKGRKIEIEARSRSAPHMFRVQRDNDNSLSPALPEDAQPHPPLPGARKSRLSPTTSPGRITFDEVPDESPPIVKPMCERCSGSTERPHDVICSTIAQAKAGLARGSIDGVHLPISETLEIGMTYIYGSASRSRRRLQGPRARSRREIPRSTDEGRAQQLQRHGLEVEGDLGGPGQAISVSRRSARIAGSAIAVGFG